MVFINGIIKWICDNYPSLGVIIVFGGGLIYITLKIKKVFTRLEEVEKIGNTNKSSIENSINPKLNNIEKGMGNVERSINALVLYLKTKDDKIDSTLFISRSPIQLTDLGDEIIVKMGGKKFIDETLSGLIAAIDSNKPKTALDVDANCKVVLFDYSNKDEFNKIKNFIFSNPVYRGKHLGNDTEVKLDLPVAIELMSIYLRNKYLEVRPALNTEA